MWITPLFSGRFLFARTIVICQLTQCIITICPKTTLYKTKPTKGHYHGADAAQAGAEKGETRVRGGVSGSDAHQEARVQGETGKEFEWPLE